MSHARVRVVSSHRSPCRLSCASVPSRVRLPRSPPIAAQRERAREVGGMGPMSAPAAAAAAENGGDPKKRKENGGGERKAPEVPRRAAVCSGKQMICSEGREGGGMQGRVKAA